MLLCLMFSLLANSLFFASLARYLWNSTNTPGTVFYGVIFSLSVLLSATCCAGCLATAVKIITILG